MPDPIFIFDRQGRYVVVNRAAACAFGKAPEFYEFLRQLEAYKKTLGLKDFSPLSQDLIALQQIRERRALPLIQAGKIREAIKAVSNIWASLPGAGYGQHEHKIADLLAVYRKAGGTVVP